MHRRTKIVATLGPATDRKKTLLKRIEAGLDVARINFSHGDPAEHRRRAEQLRAVAEECHRDVGLLGDLQGPKIRVQRFRERAVELQDGASFFIDSSLGFEEGTEEGVGVALDTLHEDVEAGDILLLNDGMISLQVERIDGTRVHTTVINGGILSNHKGINKKGGGLSAPALTDVDRENIKLAAELGMDFLAVSFVRDGNDIREARRLFEEAGGTGLLVAKIERVEAVEAIDSIVDAADIIMVARGDLGVEMGYAELTGIQKKLIRKTRKASKIVITATQMMESMIQNPIPTRAEVSDVSNAVMDGTDAVMLSGETAVGRYPVKGAEKYPLPEGLTRHRIGDYFGRVDEAIAMAVMYTANHLEVTAIIALTESGSTARWMSRIRSDIPIYALTPHSATSRRVTIYRGVIPVSFGQEGRAEAHPYRAVFDTLLSRNLASAGDYVIVTRGDVEGVSGGTNSMTIVQVTEAD
jgi:pyruvate kinase